MNKIINKIELLSPSGDKTKAYYALNYGADAIYIGAKEFSLRKRAGNFDIEDIKEIVNYAHSLNKKVYLVMNVICRNFLFKDFHIFFKKIQDIEIDAYIVADVAIINFLNENYPEKEIHISTQQSTTNSASCLF
jgi:putative protease